jgi:transposase
MNRVARIGVDLAKNIMQLHGVEAAERVVGHCQVVELSA